MHDWCHWRVKGVFQRAFVWTGWWIFQIEYRRAGVGSEILTMVLSVTKVRPYLIFKIR